MILWEPLYLDWDAIYSNQIDSFQMTATNVGQIASDNLTFYVPDHWGDTAFMTPKENNLGRLHANSSLSFPVKLVKIFRYSVPSDRFELRDENNPNNVVFIPAIDDSQKWEMGPDIIAVNGENPANQWYYKFNSEGALIFSYSYSDHTRYDFVYNGTVVNDTEIPVDVVVTHPTHPAQRQLLDDIPKPIVPRQKSNSYKKNIGQRNLLEIEAPLDCLQALACTLCEALWSKVKKGIQVSNGVPSSVGIALKAVEGVITMCDAVKKVTSYSKYGFAAGMTPDILVPICNTVNPCKWFCKSTNFGGCTGVRAPKSVCYILNLSNPHFSGVSIYA